MPEPKPRSGAWRDWAADETADVGFKRLTREEAAALRAKDPQVSPWWVVAGQATVGTVVALAAWLVGGRPEFGWSALYGTITAVVPTALMARAMTNRFASLSPGVAAVSVMVWETVKVGAAVGLLAMAPIVVRPLSWPALLAALAACLSVYWFALLWRGRKS